MRVPTLEIGVGFYMGNLFKVSTKDRNSTPRRPDKSAKELRVLYDNPIIIPQDPEPSDESPLPADNNAGPGFILIGGSVLALLCLWWLAPQWLDATWKNLIRQILHFVGQ